NSLQPEQYPLSAAEVEQNRRVGHDDHRGNRTSSEARSSVSGSVIVTGEILAETGGFGQTLAQSLPGAAF
ncbi:MAG TPA: hypothetical protein VMS21_13050, partial [Methylomirabilota bacterium]|nr:hypothetical protein [Methylomirabilota bacterium]